jgi:probable F420-dependent oxidoreductase
VIRLGLNVPNFGPTAVPEILRRWIRFAEDSGFALAMMSDHVAPTPDVTALYPPPFYDPFATLSWLGGLTDRLELGTTVTILPYRHPLLTARMATNIDQFTGGRFILGVGVGWSEAEFTALGLPFRDRGRITDEYLLAVTQAWTNDQVSLDGDYVSDTDVSTGPRPARSPHPPIWVGGTAPAAIRRAARFGDAWHPNNARLDWLRTPRYPRSAPPPMHSDVQHRPSARVSEHGSPPTRTPRTGPSEPATWRRYWPTSTPWPTGCGLHRPGHQPGRSQRSPPPGGRLAHTERDRRTGKRILALRPPAPRQPAEVRRRAR